MRACTRREFLGLSGAALAAAPLWTLWSCSKEEPTVNFFNWSDYIAKDTLPNFSRKTGIRVNYSVYSDEEEMFAKLRSGARGYDLVVATDYMVPRLKSLNLIEPYPENALTNSGHIDPKFRHTPYDPDDAYTVPYLWGTTGIGYNKKNLPRAPDSWWALWDKKYQGRISMLDNARDAIGIALLLEGRADADEAALRSARKLLLEQKPLLKQYSSSNYVDGLIDGEVDVAMAWSGDIMQAARENPELDYVIPKEGSYIWSDNLCLARFCPHQKEALALADYLLEGKVAADISNAVRYATPNNAAKPFLEVSLLKDPREFPPPSVLKRLRFYPVLPPDLTQAWNDAWSDIKAS